MTGDHILTQTPLQGIELRPEGAIPLSAAALAQRMGVSVASAYRMIAATAAAQHDPTALRVVRLPVVTGKGARRDALHILWPVH